MLSHQEISSYLQYGIFFVTICTHKRAMIFAAEDTLEISTEGQIARECWLNVPQHFSYIKIDEFVIMPNHIHVLLAFTNKTTTFQNFASAKKGSLITILKVYKAAVTRNINALPSYDNYTVWQRGYFDYRIRNENDLLRVRKYIRNNPKRWLANSKD